MKDKKEIYDAVVIGCGPAGLQASIYLSRAGLKTLVIGKKIDSRLNWAHTIDNYLGFFDGIDGGQLLENGLKQAQRFGTEVLDGEVVDISKDTFFNIKTASEVFLSRSVFFATGVQNKVSGVLGEKEFVGKGVAYCVTCDGVLFKDKKVIVVGESDYAAKESLELLSYTKNVSIYSNGKDFTISKSFLEKIKENNISLHKEKIKEFSGNNMLSGAILENGESIGFDGVFVAVGVSSSSSLALGLGVYLNNNYITVDMDGGTNVSGVFAAGDVTGFGMQVSTAVGTAARAAMSVVSYIKSERVE